MPDGDLAEEAYGVLRDALRASGRLGLGQFVMCGRQYVTALKPCGNGLLLETLRFAEEVRSAAPLFSDVESATTDNELLGLAKELIERKRAPFDPRQFKDNYTAAVRDLIDATLKRKKPVQVEEEEPACGAQVIDLVEALKRSVRTADRAPSADKTGTRKAS